MQSPSLTIYSFPCSCDSPASFTFISDPNLIRSLYFINTEISDLVALKGLGEKTIDKLKLLINDEILKVKAENKEVKYIGRQPAASPATGYLKKHLAQQKEIIEKVLN